ncbi:MULTISPECIES: Asp-tRNA(Asn)/Glu-tRNA(Gln) amidotransferase subunit GatC [Thioalkalivibrio]|uniref:Aspartyl/glutamyl-tRNA(Asn/Gln) amidotransferase subunit C n=1 Tax=Thioalkalivibrio halophilus TaxID=252474 RepID=A0A1V2ZYZ9_9GAMM|nr:MULTISPECIES: Asp-tRNA(Asn)/Glu-tRNA(Gln) amidotransferase subunit GatC [Thioalkalivibrio]OOC10291.1 asparaginyl/glutamyl-tRNA amidotransferase subunit C [Thioalkalivibrio halophilus]PYG03176.1 aspartyl/glutamyl-tRNA(Asn/Gln) amidotransferase subunit C [Thioalkalivibrio sp. ALE21]
MSVDTEHVQRIAELSRLAMDDDQAREFAGGLSDIFDFVEQLDGADIEGVEPMAHPMDAAQRLRPDAVTEPDRRDDYQAIAPAVEGGLYLVPRVIE